MKTLTTLLLILGFSMAAHAENSPLAGSYLMHTADCIVGGLPAGTVQPLKVEVSADEGVVQMTTQVQTQFSSTGFGTSTIQEMNVGDFGSVALGGSTFRQTGVYSNNMNTFVYTEYDNEAVNLPLHELRSTKYELNGSVLQITQTGDGAAASVCVLTKAN